MDSTTSPSPPPKKKKKSSSKKALQLTFPKVAPPPTAPTQDDKLKVYWFDNVFEGKDYRWVHLKRKDKETSFLVGNIPYVIGRLAQIYNTCSYTDGMKLKSKLEEILNDM